MSARRQDPFAKVRRVVLDHDRMVSELAQCKGVMSPEVYEGYGAMADFMHWMTGELETQRLRNKKLYRLIFGPSSEKTRDVLSAEAADASAEGESSAMADERSDDSGPKDAGRGGAADAPQADDRPKGHGRNPAAAYHGADKTCVNHESLRPGEACPACGKGKVYAQKTPAVIVRVTGGAPLAANVFELQRLRCNLCGEVFTAQAPPEADGRKYDETAAAMIAILRYGSGLPHNRIERLQRSLGIPLPASTQWDVISRAAPSVQPVYEELIRQAAQGEVIHNDDTNMPVLALTGKRRAKEAPPDDPSDRTGMFTTGIVSLVQGRRLALFFTGRRHAGENLSDLLKRRASELEPPIQMCDGLSRNIPQAFATVLAKCMSHGRRYFVDIADNFPEQCRHVLETLAEVFVNDATARKEHMTAEQRLTFHQTHSRPLMEGLQAWFEEQLADKKVEPNSGLGQAFAYMRNHWDGLTLFLRKPGAPLSNNIVERALKRAIMHRNNSLFYRSLAGARIGDAFMSLIYTAELSGADPRSYLVAIQRHADDVRRAPADWMPWNYPHTRDHLDQAA